MKSIKVIDTKDGSRSLFVPDIDETYHSTHGALGESLHVYIEMGLKYGVDVFKEKELRIFELGFGTGLNALLTALYARHWNLKVHYVSIEKKPLPLFVHRELAYTELAPLNEFQAEAESIFLAEWNRPSEIIPQFCLEKLKGDFFDFQPSAEGFHLLFFDAFGYRAQSELWDERAFQRCADLLVPGGVLVTYASKGSARRALMASGFEVEKLPGAPGKREMIRAIRKS